MLICCLSVRQHVCLPACLLDCMSVCLSIWRSIELSFEQFNCLIVRLFVSVCLSSAIFPSILLEFDWFLFISFACLASDSTSMSACSLSEFYRVCVYALLKIQFWSGILLIQMFEDRVRMIGLSLNISRFMTDWLTDWLTDRLTDRPTDWLTVDLSVCMARTTSADDQYSHLSRLQMIKNSQAEIRNFWIIYKNDTVSCRTFAAQAEKVSVYKKPASQTYLQYGGEHNKINSNNKKLSW